MPDFNMLFSEDIPHLNAVEKQWCETFLRRLARLGALASLHHERLDGRGYPNGILADRIPIGAQIVAVADALDAMTSDRPYRAALPLHQAMTELRLGRSTQWNPAVVDTVDRLLNVDKRELSFGGSLTPLQLA